MPYQTINHIQIYYESHGQGQPLVLIHGLGASSQDWEYQIAALSKNFQVLIFDLRGHGQTDKPDEPYTVVQFAQDTAALIAHFFPQGAHVLGHSLGGMIAFQLTLDAPHLVKSLIVLNSAPKVDLPKIKDSVFFMLRALNVKLFGMKYLSQYLGKILFPNPDQLALQQRFILHWRQNDPKAYINALHAFKNWDVSHRISTITCPTLMITADQDYTPISVKEKYTHMIPGAQLIVIEYSRHITMMDQPEVFNQSVLKFLADQ